MDRWIVRNRIAFAAAFVFACTSATAAFAQPAGESFRRTWKGTDLIVLGPVQEELKLSEEQIRRVREIHDDLARAVQELAGGLSVVERRDQRPELAVKSAALRDAALDEVAAVLNESQRARFREIRVRVAGPAALAERDVARAAGLSDEQRAKVVEAEANFLRKTRETVQGVRDGDVALGDLAARLERIASDADAERLSVLNDDQKVAYEKLKGKDFRLTRLRGLRGLFTTTPSHRRIERRAYRFEEADRDMEYALYVPTTYKPEKKAPLIVALHGLGGNPLQVMRYGQLTELAEKRGYIVVAPMGYNERGWYGSQGHTSRISDPPNLGELSEKDVMNVLGIVRKEFAIDDDRIYLMGHSMGGAGTWHLGIEHPDLWAALAPIAPAPSIEGPAGLEKIKHLPVIVVQGDEDLLVPVASTRRWTNKMKSLGMDHIYIEVPGGGHIDVALDNIPQIIDFFDKHERKRKP